MNFFYQIILLQLSLVCAVNGAQNVFNIKEYVTCSLPDVWESDGAYEHEIAGVGTIHALVLKHKDTYNNLVICYLDPVNPDIRKHGPEILKNSFLGISAAKAAEQGETIGEKEESVKEDAIYYRLSIRASEGKDSYLRGISFEWREGALIFHYLGYSDIDPALFDVILKQFKSKEHSHSEVVTP
ncbi:hypothetical protein [Cerasicoccus fimbriatus]|uniref:hypothetical protein n=1 Tax=Cerasicoccus fimbriatus TaxID=3014554 RepID=UPI0022B2DA52|nr:hypothetical protein [Cerasicoccus sp. TK19100]